jgi:hypothetical protein
MPRTAVQGGKCRVRAGSVTPQSPPGVL